MSSSSARLESCPASPRFFPIFTLFIVPWQHAFGWNHAQIAQAFSLAAISVAICSPFLGRLLDRFDPRRLIAAMMLAFGLGIASFAWLTPSLHQLYATAIFLGVAGTGTYQLGYARVVAGWFERRLGTALSIVVAGSGFGSLFLPPLVQFSITNLGWRSTFLILAALPLLLGAPLTYFCLPPPPIQHRRTSATDPAAAEEGVNWKQALATRSFWLIALGVCCMSLAENSSIVHLAPMLHDRGIQLEDAAFVVSFLGVASIAGRLLLGWLLDYLRGSLIAAGSLLLAGTGLILLARGHSYRADILAALIAGLGMGCEFDLMPYMLKRYFGMQSFSTAYGLIYTVYAVAGAIAPLIAGHVYDITGSYTRVLVFFSCLTLLAGAAMFALPRYRYAVPARAAVRTPVLKPETVPLANTRN